MQSPIHIVVHVTTITSGMGVDCPDVRHIIHLGPTENIENYVQ
jgi:superfamily II DNA helicase RecQ